MPPTNLFVHRRRSSFNTHRVSIWSTKRPLRVSCSVCTRVNSKTLNNFVPRPLPLDSAFWYPAKARKACVAARGVRPGTIECLESTQWCAARSFSSNYETESHHPQRRHRHVRADRSPDLVWFKPRLYYCIRGGGRELAAR